jgi:hypothetical protein
MSISSKSKNIIKDSDIPKVVGISAIDYQYQIIEVKRFLKKEGFGSELENQPIPV